MIENFITSSSRKIRAQTVLDFGSFFSKKFSYAYLFFCLHERKKGQRTLQNCCLFSSLFSMLDHSHDVIEFPRDCDQKVRGEGKGREGIGLDGWVHLALKVVIIIVLILKKRISSSVMICS